MPRDFLETSSFRLFGIASDWCFLRRPIVVLLHGLVDELQLELSLHPAVQVRLLEDLLGVALSFRRIIELL